MISSKVCPGNKAFARKMSTSLAIVNEFPRAMFQENEETKTMDSKQGYIQGLNKYTGYEEYILAFNSPNEHLVPKG